MELLQLKYFKAVAEIGKISTAAEQLFISSPGLSTSISRLEKELGVKLFERTNNQILLNEQGRIFLRYVNQVFDTLECAQKELNDSILRQEEHVSVVTATSNMWTDLITAFSAENPHFTISSTGLKISQLSNRGLLSKYTFLLMEENDLPADILTDMNYIELFEDQLAIVVHAMHPFADRDSVKLCELQKENILFPTEDMLLRKLIVRLYHDCEISLPNDNMLPYNIYRRMTEKGIGIYFSTEHIGKTDMSDLKYIPVENPCGPLHMNLYWRKNSTLTEAEEKFKSFAKNYNVS